MPVDTRMVFQEKRSHYRRHWIHGEGSNFEIVTELSRRRQYIFDDQEEEER